MNEKKYMLSRFVIPQAIFKKNKYRNDFNENPTQSEQGSFFLLSAVKSIKLGFKKNFLKKFNFFAYNFENFWLSVMRG